MIEIYIMASGLFSYNFMHENYNMTNAVVGNGKQIDSKNKY